MSRAPAQFVANWNTVSQFWERTGEYHRDEIAEIKAILRLEMGPDGAPYGQQYKGWTPMSQDERIAAWSATFAELAAQVRRDLERSKRIRMEMTK